MGLLEILQGLRDQFQIVIEKQQDLSAKHATSVSADRDLGMAQLAAAAAHTTEEAAHADTKATAQEFEAAIEAAIEQAASGG